MVSGRRVVITARWAKVSGSIGQYMICIGRQMNRERKPPMPLRVYNPGVVTPPESTRVSCLYTANSLECADESSLNYSHTLTLLWASYCFRSGIKSGRDLRNSYFAGLPCTVGFAGPTSLVPMPSPVSPLLISGQRIHLAHTWCSCVLFHLWSSSLFIEGNRMQHWKSPAFPSYTTCYDISMASVPAHHQLLFDWLSLFTFSLCPLYRQPVLATAGKA